jgi:long-chain acyl-CoA synthetase
VGVLIFGQLESVYRSATVVANICVYASITETHPIAIIVPAEPALKKLADAIGVQGHGIGDLVYDERIQQEVLKQLQAVGRKASFAGIEIIAGVVLADEEWTPQNVDPGADFPEFSADSKQNMITATLKLNRRGIFERYRKTIETAYAKNK